jgi:hypothetical protein
MSLADSVEEYYRVDPRREERLQGILNKEAGFSLREIDWFVTNMSARKPQIFRNPKTGRIVDVNSDYKDILRCYHKATFDSFRRKGAAAVDDDETIRELKQRNFFRWALENGIVDVVSENIREIKGDMFEMRKKRRRSDAGDGDKSKKKKKRRREDAMTTTIVQQPTELKIPSFTNVIW